MTCIQETHHVRVVFDRWLNEVADEEIEVCIRGMDVFQMCEIRFSDKKSLIISKVSPSEYCIQGGASQEQRIQTLFNRINSDQFSRPKQVWLKSYQWGVAVSTNTPNEAVLWTASFINRTIVGQREVLFYPEKKKQSCLSKAEGG